MSEMTIEEIKEYLPHRYPFLLIDRIVAFEPDKRIVALKSRGHKNDGKWVYYFVGIDGARFKKPVTPGDQLHIEVIAGRTGRGMAKFKAVARVGDMVAAEAELLCALRQL